MCSTYSFDHSTYYSHLVLYLFNVVLVPSSPQLCFFSILAVSGACPSMPLSDIITQWKILPHLKIQNLKSTSIFKSNKKSQVISRVTKNHRRFQEQRKITGDIFKACIKLRPTWSISDLLQLQRSTKKLGGFSKQIHATP